MILKPAALKKWMHSHLDGQWWMVFCTDKDLWEWFIKRIKPELKNKSDFAACGWESSCLKVGVVGTVAIRKKAMHSLVLWNILANRMAIFAHMFETTDRVFLTKDETLAEQISIELAEKHGVEI